MVHAYCMGMYLRITERRNRDGSTVAYYALAENIWNPEARRSETRVVHSFGRAGQLDKAALQRLVASINRVIDNDATEAAPTREQSALPEIDIEAVFELGVVVTARRLWEKLGIGEAIRTRMARADLTAPHETALFAMAAQRLDDPGSKLACATRWLPDAAWLPEADGITVDQLYRALDFLAVWSEEIERDVFLRAADLLRLDVDLIFYDTTTAYFEIDQPDDHEEQFAGKLFAPLRQRGHSKEGRDANPQVVIALAVTRDGMPVRSWVLPGNTADVTTVSRIKQDLHAWRLGRCLFVGDAGTGDVLVGEQPEVLQGDEAAADGPVDVVRHRLDPSTVGHGGRDERQIGRDVGEAREVEPPSGSEALDPAKQRRHRHLVVGEDVHKDVAREPAREGERVADVGRQPEACDVHRSSAPTNQPSPARPRPSPIEPRRLSQATRCWPSSASRSLSTIHVENVV